MFDFTLIRKAGLTQKQFAQLVGVNRITVNLWVSGKYSPGGAELRKRVAAALVKLKSAIDAGELPVKKFTYRQVVDAKLAKLTPSHEGA